MCYQTKITKSKEEMEKHFQARATGMDDFVPSEVFKAFDYPKTPVITREDQDTIQPASWGLVPHWSGSDWNRNYTLNARLETLSEKPAFRDAEEQRCLVIVNGFYEWQHVNNSKIKYEIGFEDRLFVLAGLYQETEQGLTYTVVTTEAKGIMVEIHKTKLRMPFAMKEFQRMQDWLEGGLPAPEYDFNTYPDLYRQNTLF